MGNVFYVGVGGALGAILRFGVTTAAARLADGPFPWGTMSVNWLGSFVAGILAAWLESAMVPQGARLFWIVGVLGGFTTFSAFSIENFQLLRAGQFGLFLLNTVLSVGAGVALAGAGYSLGRTLLSR